MTERAATAPKASNEERPAEPPPTEEPSRAEPRVPDSPAAEVQDLIPDDVESSLGGATGDLWEDAYATADPAPSGNEAPVEVRPAKAPKAGTRPTPRTAPKRSARPAFAREMVASDTEQGKAFAEVQELFPGRVVEVVALQPESDQEGPQGAAEVTEVELTAGYDDQGGQDATGDDA